MPDDEMPTMTSRDDPMTNHVEFIGPFERTFVLLNGHEVPNLSVGGEEGDQVLLVVDHRIGYWVPKGAVDAAVGLVAETVAHERGYPCWPSTPGQEVPRSSAFGPVWMAVEAVSTEEPGDDPG